MGLRVNERKAGLTISDVADAAGVARSSVSRAFTRPEMLSGATVRRIRDAAERLGYVPNHAARALSTGRHGNVALIVPDVANPFFPPLIRAVQREADRRDFCVFLGNTDEDPAQELKLLGRLAGQVEGLILVSSRLPDAQIRAHVAKIPLVLVNRDVAGIARVLIDSGPGVAEAVTHLAGLGHRRIVYLGGPAGSWSNRQRRAAVRATATRHRMAVTELAVPIPSHEAGRQAVADVVGSGATAVVAFDDVTAQGVLAGLAERGIAVPSAFGVVGCDDVLAATSWPPLTTVSSRSVEAGAAAFGLLMDRLADRTIADGRHVLEIRHVLETRQVLETRYVLETRLIVRDTTTGYGADGHG